MYWILTLLCVAGGTLTKWTAPAFFYLTVVPFLAWRGELRLLFGWRHLLACAIGAGVCAAWVLAVSQQIGWETLVETIRKEAAYRFSPKSASRGYPWGDVGTYPALVIAAHLPVAFFALLTLRPGFASKWDDRGKLLLQLLHCWTWPNLLFWTLVPNHNVRYALPMSPGLMGLGVMGLVGAFRSLREYASPHPPRASLAATSPTRGEVIAVTSPLVGEVADSISNPRVGGALEETVAPRLRLGVVAFLAVWLVAKVVFVHVAVAQRTEKHNAEPIAAELRDLVPADQPVYLFRLKDEGVMFYLNRPGVRLHSPRDLPRGSVAILIQPEWQDRAAFGHLELIHWTRDQQGDALFLVRAP